MPEHAGAPGPCGHQSSADPRIEPADAASAEALEDTGACGGQDSRVAAAVPSGSPEPVQEEPGKPVAAVARWLSTAPPGPRAARLVRVLTGVNEQVLDEMPTERPRYTALACVMICTACIGGVSMFLALTEITGGASGWFAPSALLWSAFVLCLDRWLVASMVGRRTLARIATAVFRLFVAVIFGFIIAEPLVLRIFQTAIVAQIRSDRADRLDQLQGELEACNPVSSAQVQRASGTGCADFRLPVASAAALDQAEIISLRSSVQTLQDTVNAQNTELQRLSDRVQNECNGVRIPGQTTGGFGDGPACQQDYEDYLDYKNSTPLSSENIALESLESKITALDGDETSSSVTQQDQIDAAIRQRLGNETQVDAPIGLIERLEAIDSLSSSSAAVSVSAWLVRIFFVLIDCLPVLVKVSSGRTPYDEQAAALVGESLVLYELRRSARLSVWSRRTEAEAGHAAVEAERIAQLAAFELRRNAAELATLESQAIDEEFARRMQAAASTPPAPAPAKRLPRSVAIPAQVNGRETVNGTGYHVRG